MTTQPSRQTEAARPAQVVLPLALLLAARLVLGAAYAVVVPIWEAYDEDGHFAYVRYIATHWTLLKPGDPEAQKVWEKFQPPLYYALAAPLIAGFDLGPTWVGPQRNPYFSYGNAGANYALHPAQVSPAAQQIEMAAYIVRLFSVALSTAAVVFVFLSAQLLWPTDKRRVWAAVCLYAFWPQILFNGSMITNDALVSALAAPMIYLALRFMLKGHRWRDAALLGVTVAAAVTAKLNAVAFLPPVLIALGSAWTKMGRRSHRRWLALAAVGVCLAAAFGLVTSLRFVTQQVLQLRTLTRFLANLDYITHVPHTLAYSLRTFWASFGWGNLETYAWLYPVWTGLASLALFGLVWGLLRRRSSLPRSALILLSLHLLSVLVLSLALTIAARTGDLAHGRYLLTALPAVVLLLIEGWQALLPEAVQASAWKAVSLGVLCVGWFIPFMTLAPAYAWPPPANPAVIQSLQPIGAVLGDRISLPAYRATLAGTVGQTAGLELCWQATAPVDINYALHLDVVGPDGQGYGGLTTYPGHGNYPTSFWRVDSPFCETYMVPVAAGFPAPAVARIHIGLLDAGRNQWLPLTQLGGRPYQSQIAPSVPTTGTTPPPNSDPVYAEVKIKAAVTPSLAGADSVEYRFGQELVLLGYALEPPAGGQTGVRVALEWKAATDISSDYVVFVHLRDTPAHIYAQGDSEPRGGWYPTQWWSAGETVVDEHAITLPAGPPPPLDLYVGVYDRATGTRLPVVDAQGRAVANDEVILARGLTLP